MQELEKILEEIDRMVYPAEGIGCGLEDVSITDRYESAEYGWNEAIERVTEIIRNNMNDGWISVDDRLPEDRETVLCTDGENIYLVEYDADLDAGFGDMDCITAWRPIPEPYRPERRENDSKRI